MNKSHNHNIVSWIALVLSIIACIITWVRVDVYFTNDTFVGIMAGFMGACATIVVGAQIYNSIETSRKIKELESLQTQINSDIKYLKEEREKSLHMTKYGLNHSLGISTCISGNKFYAYDAFFTALEEALILDNTTYINGVLNNIEVLCNKIKSKSEKVVAKVFIIEKYNPKNLSKYNSYKLIETKYEEYYETIKEAYEKCIKQSQTAS